MGTSQSSTGPLGAVSLVPPWADESDDHSNAPSPNESDGSDGQDGAEDSSGAAKDPKAPPRRFTSTRANLRSYATTGDSTRMRRAVRDYVSTGYGGASTMSRRLSRTAAKAQSLNDVMAGRAPEILDRALLAGRSPQEVMDAVGEALAPPDGTQDAEATRESIHDAQIDVLDRYPGANILNLDEGQRMFMVQRYTASEIYHRFMLDVGKHLQDAASDPLRALNLASQIRDFINIVVERAFDDLASNGTALTDSTVRHVQHQALKNTMTVFATYHDEPTA